MNRINRKFLIILGLAFSFALPLKVDAGETIVFGFLPILSPQKLVARFGPLADFLSEQLGKPVRLETAANYAEFVRRTHQKRYDILFTAPHFYYLAQREAGYKVLARVNAPSLAAIIVTRRDSGIKTLEDLRGKRLATVDPLALGTALVKAHLRENNIDPDRDLTLVATPTHNASLLSAYKRVTDAASLMVPPFKRARPEIKNTMTVLAKTAGTAHMPVSVSDAMSPEDATIIEQSLLNLNKHSEGKALLKHLSWPGFIKTSPAEYDHLEWAARQVKLAE